MALTVLLTTRRYGVPPSLIHYISVNNWSIAKNYMDCFQRYYILSWKTSFFWTQVENGTISHNNVEYLVIYHRTTRGKLLREWEEGQKENIALSFRQAQPEFNLPAYVLVN